MSNFAMRHLSSPAGAWDDVSIRASGFLSWEKPPRRSWFSIACQHLLNHFLGHSVRNCILLEITDWMNTPPKESKKCKTYFLLSNPNIIFPISKHIAIQYPLANANSGWIGMSLNMFPKTYAYLPRQPTKTTEGKKMVSCHGMTLLPCCTVWSPLITKHFQKQSWYIIQIDALIFCHIPKKSIPPNPHPLNSLWISVDFTDSRHSLRDPFPAQPWPTPASPASSASCWAGPKAWGSGAAPVPRRGRWDKRGSKAPWTSYIQIIQRCWWW